MEFSMATTSHLALEGVSCVLPNGQLLFSDLTECIDQRRTALVGRNGCGKTMLARMLAGQIAPTQGQVVRSGKLHYLAQQHIAPTADATVADLAGVRGTLDALADRTSIEYVYQIIAYLPLLGLVAALLPKMRHARH